MKSLKSCLKHPKSVYVLSKETHNAFNTGLDLYKKYLLENFSDKEHLDDKTYISPRKLHLVNTFSERFYERHKHKFSGRSFGKGFSYNKKNYVINCKGAHLLENGKVRGRHLDAYYAPPAFGCETEKQLGDEFQKAMYLQEKSLQQTGNIGPFPLPLKVSIPEGFMYKGKCYDYKSFIEYIFCDYKAHTDNLFFVLRNYIPDIGYPHPEKEGVLLLKEEFCNPEYVHQKYREHIGDHGSYMYIIQHTNMRIADVLQAPSREEMQAIIRSYYPGLTDEDICKQFMKTFGQAYGILLGSGLQYKPHDKNQPISNCFSVDTTIMGHAVDIDGYTLVDSIEEFTAGLPSMGKHHWTYGEICFFFYTIFFPITLEHFLDMYKTYFTTTYVNYMMQQLDASYSIDNNTDRNTVQKELIEYFYNEGEAFVTQRIIQEKNPRSDAKYLHGYMDKIIF